MPSRPRTKPPRPGPHATTRGAGGGTMPFPTIYIPNKPKPKRKGKYQHDPRPLSEIYKAEGDMAAMRASNVEKIKAREVQSKKDKEKLKHES